MYFADIDKSATTRSAPLTSCIAITCAIPAVAGIVAIHIGKAAGTIKDEITRPVLALDALDLRNIIFIVGLHCQYTTSANDLHALVRDGVVQIFGGEAIKEREKAEKQSKIGKNTADNVEYEADDKFRWIWYPK